MIDPRSFWLGFAAAYVVSFFAGVLFAQALRMCSRAERPAATDQRHTRDGGSCPNVIQFPGRSA